MPNRFGIDDIFKKYRNKIYGLALSISKNEEDAEDILQNTFIKIMQNIKNFRNESRLSTWIYRVAYNESLMSLRKKHNRYGLYYDEKRYDQEIPSGIFVNWAKLPDKQLIDSEFKERLDNAIKHMPIKYRLVLLLNVMEDLSLKDTASVLRLKISSLKTRLHRARMMIKKEISDYLKDKEEKEEKEGEKCGILVSFVREYADGSLGKKREEAFKGHIKDCKSCNQFLNNYLKAIKITNTLECNDIPNELKNRIEIFLQYRKVRDIFDVSISRLSYTTKNRWSRKLPSAITIYVIFSGWSFFLKFHAISCR